MKLPFRCLRFILVLPASIAALMGSQILIVLLSYFLSSNSVYDNWLCQLWSSIVPLVCCVIAGAYTAPSHRSLVAWAMVILLACFFGVVAGWAFAQHSYSAGRMGWLAFCGFLGLVSAACAASYVGHQSQQSDKNKRLRQAVQNMPSPALPPIHPTHPINHN